jgi:hypothetical protein
MGDYVLPEPSSQPILTAQEVIQLEDEGKLLRVLQPDVLERIKDCLATSRQKVEPFIVESNGAIYFSLMSMRDPEQRQRAIHKIQQWQVGVDVDLSSLPRPLHQLLQPHRAISQRLLRVALLSGIVGIIAGILAMALSIFAVSVAELVFGTTPEAFGDMQITAVAFVIFAVLGWIVVTPLIWNRLDR